MLLTPAPALTIALTDEGISLICNLWLLKMMASGSDSSSPTA